MNLDVIPEAGVWTIFFLPLASFLIIAFIVRPFFNNFSFQSGLITIIAIAASFALSIWALQSVISEDINILFPSHEWVTIGALDIGVGLILDPLSAIMLVVVTGVSLMVQIYSLGYMKGDPSFSRYFAIMSLFTASMVGLVISRNIIQLYVFWELVGVCSYLLIGFWYTRPAATAAAKKAFIVTRIGDLGFLIAILYLFFNTSTFSAAGLNGLDIVDIHTAAVGGVLGSLAVTWLSLGIFAGAVGKSAQFPLHVWLPDAMEGPTPVSSLIHAATMVAAGVFLVARFFPVFQASENAMSTVAIIGGATALFAATMSLVMNDIKRVLAYSTISQLGYMIAALGIGAYAPAIFHLFNHAFFKCLLFMGAGSVNHATGTFDMRYMGGLRRIMPFTYITMLIGALSLAGIFPLAGFWSKDEILFHAWDGHGSIDTVVFWLLIVGVFVTAAYSFRMIYMTFHGAFRGGVDSELAQRAAGSPAGAERGVHLAESPWVMILPMVILAVAAVISGGIANPQVDWLGPPAHWFSHFLGATTEVDVPLAATSVIVGSVGILVATAVYFWPKVSLETVGRPFKGIHQLLSQKYYMDHLYEGQIVSRGIYRGIALLLDWFDRQIVDNIADFLGWLPRHLGRAIGLFQDGQVQRYGVAISLGVFVIVGAYLVWG